MTEAPNGTSCWRTTPSGLYSSEFQIELVLRRAGYGA